MTAGRLRVVYRTREAHTFPRCGRGAVRCDFLGDVVAVIKTHHQCFACFLRTLAFDTTKPPENHGWIHIQKGIEQ